MAKRKKSGFNISDVGGEGDILLPTYCSMKANIKNRRKIDKTKKTLPVPIKDKKRLNKTWFEYKMTLPEKTASIRFSVHSLKRLWQRFPEVFQSITPTDLIEMLFYSDPVANFSEHRHQILKNRYQDLVFVIDLTQHLVLSIVPYNETLNRTLSRNQRNKASKKLDRLNDSEANKNLPRIKMKEVDIPLPLSYYATICLSQILDSVLREYYKNISN